MAEEAPKAPEGEPKKARGRPKDDQAPPKPKNAMQRVQGEARKRIKEENPALAQDLSAMMAALREAWEKTPQDEKDRLTAIYEKEMEIWKPKWAAYKETDHYKAFFELKQDYIDLKTKKKLIKTHQRGKIVEGNVVRVGANFEMAYPEDAGTANNYPLKMGQRGTIVSVDAEKGQEKCEIQWDGGEKRVLLKKYYTKLEDPEIPKRPKSGYMIFGGDMREKATQEVFAAGGGLGDVGKKISEWWDACSEAKKAEYAERSARMKEKFDKEFIVYKMTGKYKGFENTKVKLESKQKLNKLKRTTWNEAPKRAPSASALWKETVGLPKLQEEYKAKGTKPERGELAKRVAELWKEVPQEEKDRYEKDAAVKKTEYMKQHLNFKKNNKYMKFLEERAKVKKRENRIVNLRDMPKRPSSVFSLYAKEHKTEVPQGKGEGKGVSALKQKFASAPEDEKAMLAKKVEEATEQWKKELEEYKEGDQYKTYTKTEEQVKKEFMTEAMKVMQLKFFKASPPAPPRNAFAIYVGEKRKADGAGDDEEPKSKEAKREEVKKYQGQWMQLSKEVKGEYETRKKEKYSAWKEEVTTFMAQDHWQEYLREAKRLKIPVRKLLEDKSKMKKFLKNGMRVVQMPETPDTLPKRGPSAYKLFVRDQKKESADVTPEKIEEMWKALDEAGRKPYVEEAQKLDEAFKLEMQEFRQSDDGKDFLRKKSQAMRQRITVKAKFTYLKEMPKKPEGALKIFLDRNFKQAKEESKDLKPFEVRKKLTDKWLAMSPEEREPLEKEAKDKYEQWQESMKAFKDGDNWKNYIKMTKTRPKAKKMAKPSTGIKAPKKPEDLPTKPPTALEAFGRQAENAGLDAASLQAAFQKLGADERDKLEDAAKSAQGKYEEEMAAFNQTEKGQAYQRELLNYEKRRKSMDLKAKLAKLPSMPDKPEGYPEKPKAAFRAWCGTQQGSGQDLAALHRSWAALDKEKRDEFEAAAREAEKEYQAKLEEFNKTEAGKKYLKDVANAQKRKSLGEAKAKYLAEAPQPPKGMYHFFVQANREKVARENPDLKGLGPIMQKLTSVFKELSDDEKEVYAKQAADAKEEFERQLKEFHASAEYKKYKAIEHRVSGKSSKKDDKGKKKDKGPAPPEAPADLPKKPPIGYMLFSMEVKGPKKESAQKWLELGAGGQEEWNKKHKERMVEYEKKMKEFMKTAEGKKYFRLKNAFDKKQAEKKARERCLGGENAPQEPKRPTNAYFAFVGANRKKVSEEIGKSDLKSVGEEMTKRWNDPDRKAEREEFEKKAEEEKKEYNKAMEEYNKSDAVKKFNRAVSSIKKPKKKAKAAKPKKAAKAAKATATARGGKAGAPKAKAKAAAAKDDGSDSDVMGSDSSNSSSSDSDSD